MHNFYLQRYTLYSQSSVKCKDAGRSAKFEGEPQSVRIYTQTTLKLTVDQPRKGDSDIESRRRQRCYCCLQRAIDRQLSVLRSGNKERLERGSNRRDSVTRRQLLASGAVRQLAVQRFFVYLRRDTALRTRQYRKQNLDCCLHIWREDSRLQLQGCYYRCPYLCSRYEGCRRYTIVSDGHDRRLCIR